ncbi:hypothetical protein QRB36_17555 [Mycobacterium marseillense]|uniref:hypothetical protein n=1 Tax=Mycobacterium marseillense TaxID=701042 RepID=UPI0025960F7D|nr:hypothetical protein [Mycobacterium marseillense]MDM3975976.1 hypothetical protein [Mycobacterium marseillense]
MTTKIPSVLKSWTTVVVIIGAIGLVVSLFGYARGDGPRAGHIGAVALGSAAATLVAAFVTFGVLITSRRRWAREESERLKRATDKLSQFDSQSELQSVPGNFDLLLDAAVTDAARELEVKPESLSAQILLLVGQDDELVWPKSAIKGADRVTSARRAADKNTPIAILRKPDGTSRLDYAENTTADWMISVPIPTGPNRPPLGAITLSGTNEDPEDPRTAEDLQRVVSLLLSWARLAALQVGGLGSTSIVPERRDSGD